MGQKFQRADLVDVTKDLGYSMRHFPGSGDQAYVEYSYAEKYGGTNTESYSLLFLDGSRVSWYYEHQLSLVRHGTQAEMDEISGARDRLSETQAELPWIVEHWDSSGAMPFASLNSLALACGLGSLWGVSGEGMSVYINSGTIVRLFNDSMTQGLPAVLAEIGKIKSGPKPRWSNYLFAEDQAKADA